MTDLEACSCFRLASTGTSWVRRACFHCQDGRRFPCPLVLLDLVVLPYPLDFQPECRPSFLLLILAHPFAPWIHPYRRVLLCWRTLDRRGFPSDRPTSKERGHHRWLDRRVPSPSDDSAHQDPLDNTVAAASTRQARLDLRVHCPSDRTAPCCSAEIRVARASCPDRAST